MDERAPLGELNATEFYGEGCHAFSVEVVYDDDCDKERKEKEKEEKRNEGEERAVSIDGILAMENTCSKEEKEKDENENENRFEIWESGSAHGESI